MSKTIALERSALVLLIVLLAADAGASGVAQKVTLAQGVKHAHHVLVVEPAKTPTRTVKKKHPYVDRKTKEHKVLETQRLWYRFRVLRRLGPALKAHAIKGPPVGTIIEVLDGNALLGESVHVSMVTTGTWPIPYFPQLEGRVRPAKRGRYVLLVTDYDPKTQRYQGIGGLGLLPLEREAEVRRLLSAPKRR